MNPTPTTEPITDAEIAAIRAQLTEERRERYAVMDFDTALRLLARLESAEEQLTYFGRLSEEEHQWQVARFERLEALVTEWRAARAAVLAEPTHDVRQSQTYRAALDRLANAEDALMKGVQA